MFSFVSSVKLRCFLKFSTSPCICCYTVTWWQQLWYDTVDNSLYSRQLTVVLRVVVNETIQKLQSWIKNYLWHFIVIWIVLSLFRTADILGQILFNQVKFLSTLIIFACFLFCCFFCTIFTLVFAISFLLSISGSIVCVCLEIFCSDQGLVLAALCICDYTPMAWRQLCQHYIWEHVVGKSLLQHLQ